MTETIAQWGALAWAVVGILVAAAGVFLTLTKGWGPLLNIIHWGERLNDIVNGQERINEAVEKHLIGNGDGSVLEQVTAITKKLDSLPCATGRCPANRATDGNAA